MGLRVEREQMPVDVSIHPDRTLGLFRMTGAVDVPSVLGAFRRYVDHPQFDPDFVMLTDARHVSAVNADFRGIVGGVQRALILMRRFHKETPSVICAPNDVPFGMARILQQVAEPVSFIRFEILRAEAEALEKAGQAEHSFAALDAAMSRDLPTG